MEKDKATDQPQQQPTQTNATNKKPDEFQDEFYNSGRIGRRNAMPDILDEHCETSTADLPLKLSALTTSGEFEISLKHQCKSLRILKQIPKACSVYISNVFASVTFASHVKHNFLFLCLPLHITKSLPLIKLYQNDIKFDFFLLSLFHYFQTHRHHRRPVIKLLIKQTTNKVHKSVKIYFKVKMRNKICLVKS